MPGILSGRMFPTPLLALLLAAGAGSDLPRGGRDDSPSIQALQVEQRDGLYRVSFRLASGFTPEILGKIESGLETTFDYRVEVLRRRRFWFDQRRRQRRIETSVKFDSLSRQYSLLLKADGKVQRSSTTDKPAEMRRWMTEIQEVGLGPISEFDPPENFVVRVKSDLQARFVLLFIPWDRDTEWARVPLNPGRLVSRDPGR